MKLRLLFLGCWLLLLLPARATHLVGGEFQLQHIAGSTYRITLNMYFDNLNGNLSAIDPSITVSIFEKATNHRMANVVMGNPQSTPVPYTVIACTSGALSTNKIVYRQDVTLSEMTYNSANGYYLVWERCCRNGVISNILAPGAAAQTFYLEFPAVVRQGAVFRNSSPALFPPVSDYACINEKFYYDFSGQDPDGDSLVYEMVTPLNGYSTPDEPAPLARPAPYSLVRWTAGLGVSHQLPGNPSLQVGLNSGQLTVTPSRLGLFVFGVRCSEYRRGVKIGEVRRDFQLLVLNCPRNSKPGIQVKVAGAPAFYQEGQILQLAATGGRCLQLLLTDTDPDEALSVEARPVNFSRDQLMLSTTTGLVNRNGVKDTLKTTACFSPCFDTRGQTYQVDFIVTDDGCSLPKKDTIRVSFQVPAVADNRPVITTTAAGPVLKPRIGEVLQFEVRGSDPDGEVVSLSVQGLNFALAAQPLVFQTTAGAGLATGQFRWPIDCGALGQPAYRLLFKASSQVCGKLVSDSTIIEVQPQYFNQPPEITSAMAGKTIAVAFGSPFSDSVLARDADLDRVVLAAAGQGFNLADVGMQFTAASGPGQGRGLFSWVPDCRILGQRTFTVLFSVREETCQPRAPAPLAVTFRVAEPAAGTFVPANVFTPNQDGLNDYFEMPALPPDFCQRVFSEIRIFNRWGALVYSSRDRQFRWDGRQVADGVYFYVIYYSDKQFKGTVTKVR